MAQSMPVASQLLGAAPGGLHPGACFRQHPRQFGHLGAEVLGRVRLQPRSEGRAKTGRGDSHADRALAGDGGKDEGAGRRVVGGIYPDPGALAVLETARLTAGSPVAATARR